MRALSRLAIVVVVAVLCAVVADAGAQPLSHFVFSYSRRVGADERQRSGPLISSSCSLELETHMFGPATEQTQQSLGR